MSASGSDSKFVRVVDLDGLGFSLLLVVLILCIFKCNGVVLWGPNERIEACPEVVKP